MRELKLNLAQKQSVITSLSAAVAAFLVLILITLLLFILIKGSSYFWPQNIVVLKYHASESGQVETVFAQQMATSVRADQELLHYRGTINEDSSLIQITLPQQRIISVALARHANLILVEDGSKLIATPVNLTDATSEQIPLRDLARIRNELRQIQFEVESIRAGELASIHTNLADMDRKQVETSAPARLKLAQRFYILQEVLQVKLNEIAKFGLLIEFADGSRTTINLAEVDNFSAINTMSTSDKLWSAASSFWTFLSDSPKLDNTTGGIFPALFGTIIMVLLMTIIVTPFGVLAALYLHEYAPRNKTTALIRISVNNLAGVPSIVYGVFGLGFFVYSVGSGIDSVFFEQNLPSPTFGTPGLFWASLTMAIFTLPVVIVATEEGLRRVPESLRKGSYALGATQIETLFNAVIPMASPGIMTGVILAIARGAGAVAPLMLLGAVKFAPALPVDAEFPFIHLNRQFMHLGVLIYDGAFHSQHIGNSSSFVFACCMLLLVIVFTLNLTAVFIRNRLRNQYSQL